MIAAQHYLQTRDAHFDLAAGIGEAASNPATHTRQSVPTASKSETQNPQNSQELVGVGVGCDAVETEQVPPEGQQQTRISAGNTLVLAIVVAENAAKQAHFDATQPQATACDAERACAIDLWIARCPVKIPQAIMVGIRAIICSVVASDSRS